MIIEKDKQYRVTSTKRFDGTHSTDLKVGDLATALVDRVDSDGEIYVMTPNRGYTYVMLHGLKDPDAVTTAQIRQKIIDAGLLRDQRDRVLEVLGLDPAFVVPTKEDSLVLLASGNIARRMSAGGWVQYRLTGSEEPLTDDNVRVAAMDVQPWL